MSAEIIPWPSVDDEPGDELCPWCEAMPTEKHQCSCPLYAPCFEDGCWCDGCGTWYVTNCRCSEGEE